LTTADLIKAIIVMKKLSNIITPIAKKTLLLQILNRLSWLLVEPVMYIKHSGISHQCVMLVLWLRFHGLLRETFPNWQI